MASHVRYGTGFSCPICGAELTTYDALMLTCVNGRAVASHKNCPTYVVVAVGLKTFDAGSWDEKTLWEHRNLGGK